MFQIMHPKTRIFAPWAKITKAFSSPKHYVADDGKSIVYGVKHGENYANHIEMSAFYTSCIVSYGCKENGELRIMRHAVFPSLRTYPNNTRGSLSHNFKGVKIAVSDYKDKEYADCFIFNGILQIKSTIGKLHISRKIFPATSQKCLIERIELVNTGEQTLQINVKSLEKDKITCAAFGNNGERYQLITNISKPQIELKANEKVNVDVTYCGMRLNEKCEINCDNEELSRKQLLHTLDDTLIISTPNATLNLMARYAKIRVCESIYNTKNGLMHSPGGGNYYAALWTNDQCEYVNPLFGYLGYNVGVEQSINCFEMYGKYVSSDKALITSIVAEGDDIWHGAKDRGDSAMYAYGLARFLLARGEEQLAQKFVTGLEECLAYTISKINSNGVVASDSDELENRFESGKANLCTSTLAYDAMLSASYLFNELGDSKKAQYYATQAANLEENILKYFSKNVEGYDTFMYCAEESRLRSWICMPMVVGILERSQATKDALLSPKLRMAEGLLTASGEKTFWDRSTLYSLRGLFNAGHSEEALELLEKFSTARLLGEHIPYAVEAFPEGNQAHLSAESGLYLRIFTEGILGIRPTGFGKFQIKPNLPSSWSFMECKKITFADKCIDIKVTRLQSGYKLDINNAGNLLEFEGDCFAIQL